MLSAAARRAARRTPGTDVDAVVWDELETVTGQADRLSATYLALLIVATIIASIGVLLDQPILIVGAMVVGPEFGPLAALSVGLVRRHWPVVRHSSLALVVGFLAAIVATAGFTWILTWLGLVDKSMLLAPRPLTDFIWRPERPVVGDRLPGRRGRDDLGDLGPVRRPDLGVLISVTTVPAAANAAVALAYGVMSEAGGSALQLLINLTAIVAAGVLTLFVQRIYWRRMPARDD